ncbi:PIR Superfamily Protein [Plasmodium ovale curtisi]|uniref:PIR Superfamily Protein n=1 Tax=Plasmodium ovale curtisi TaxID=864141 RepID=A0A1A8W822_PLAOA|nr:PIR Superfamily Protein [Plasmodium ovale curtisi]SBT01775.1 PIR Superfamily Protein [Plasmodium ovale curtisi]
MSDVDYDLSILNANVCYRKLDKAPNYYIDVDEQFWNNYIKEACIKKSNIFETLLKGFHYVAYLKKKDENFYDNRWNYLYFWVGSKALENVVPTCSFLEVISLLKNVREYIQKDNYDYDILKITPENFNDLKEIYDYFINYDSIELKIGGNTSNCTELYKKYVDSGYEVYDRVKSKCQHEEEEEYCKLFHYIIHKHSDKVLKKLKCNGTMPPLSVEEHRQKHLHDSPREVDVEGQIQGLGSYLQVHTGGTSPSSGSDNVMSTFFPILGIFSILFLLYNFTPFRIWSHNILSKKEIIRHNDYEDESNEFFENEYESSDRNNHYKRYDINYHSITNI